MFSNAASYSPVFHKKRGDKMSLYVDESNNPNYPNRTNTLICADLVLKDIREGVTNVGLAGTMEYKIAVFQKSRDVTVEFIQFEDGVGSILEVYKDNYICADVIYNAATLNYTIFDKNDNDNYYYERVIYNTIVSCRVLDCFVTLYSDLYNIKCAMENDKTITFTQNQNTQWVSVSE